MEGKEKDRRSIHCLPPAVWGSEHRIIDHVSSTGLLRTETERHGTPLRDRMERQMKDQPSERSEKHRNGTPQCKKVRLCKKLGEF